MDTALELVGGTATVVLPALLLLVLAALGGGPSRAGDPLARPAPLLHLAGRGLAFLDALGRAAERRQADLDAAVGGKHR